jgi:pimeloyl-ACP methyl ester carboxylesterase
MNPCRSEFFDLGGVRIHVRRWGCADAEPVFLLHGWMDVSASFQFVADSLGCEWNLIAPDWRGFGASTWLHRPYWFPDYLVDLDRLLLHYSPNAAVRLVGHSMGGIVSCLFAGVRPQRVARLATLEGFGVAVTTSEMAPAKLGKWLEQADSPPAMHRYASRAQFAERLCRHHPRLLPERAAWLAEHLAVAAPDGGFVWAGDPYHRVVNPILYRIEEAKACWRQIRAPVLWVDGAESAYIAEFLPDPADQAARKACFANLREVTMADAGHMLHYDQPKALARLLEGFLAGESMAQSAPQAD